MEVKFMAESQNIEYKASWRDEYLKMALQNLLLWLKNRGLASTPISCEPSNEASKKVILSCGGKQTDTCTYKGIELIVFEIPIV